MGKYVQYEYTRAYEHLSPLAQERCRSWQRIGWRGAENIRAAVDLLADELGIGIVKTTISRARRAWASYMRWRVMLPDPCPLWLMLHELAHLEHASVYPRDKRGRPHGPEYCLVLSDLAGRADQVAILADEL